MDSEQPSLTLICAVCLHVETDGFSSIQQGQLRAHRFEDLGPIREHDVIDMIQRAAILTQCLSRFEEHGPAEEISVHGTCSQALGFRGN